MRGARGWVLLVVLAWGCNGIISDPPGARAGATKPGGGGPGRGPTIAAPPPGHRLARLTADQFEASLEVATGQPWPDFDQYAGMMGKPDYYQTTEQGTAPSVAFERLVAEAARYSCAHAVQKDRDDGPGEDSVILRYAGPSRRDQDAVVHNLEYLVLRFHGARITSASDPRLAPWLAVISPGDTGPSDDEVATRWTAVCVGLVDHPDFLTY